MLKMDYLSSHVSKLLSRDFFAKRVSEITDLLPTIRSAHFFSARLTPLEVIPVRSNPDRQDYPHSVRTSNGVKRLDISLLIETTFITIAAILAIVAFNSNPILHRAAWFVTPGILVAAAIIPTAIKRKKFAKIGFNVKQIRYSLTVLGWTCMVVFPATLLGCWLLKSYGLNLPLSPVKPWGQSWTCWIFYQFMYVAVAEEVFFRWFLQSNIQKLTNTVMQGQCRRQLWVSILVLTFLPGLILGWLFIRTKSLLAPILFHGLANTCYFVIAVALA